MKEKWKPMYKFEEYYEVSNQGRYRRIVSRWGYNKKGKLLKKKYRSRYHYFRVSIKGEQYLVNCGRTVLLSFHKKQPSPLHECDHINRISLDNRLENLRWVTKKQNMRNRSIYKGVAERMIKLGFLKKDYSSKEYKRAWKRYDRQRQQSLNTQTT